MLNDHSAEHSTKRLHCFQYCVQSEYGYGIVILPSKSWKVERWSSVKIRFNEFYRLPWRLTWLKSTNLRSHWKLYSQWMALRITSPTMWLLHNNTSWRNVTPRHTRCNQHRSRLHWVKLLRRRRRLSYQPEKGWDSQNVINIEVQIIGSIRHRIEKKRYL